WSTLMSPRRTARSPTVPASRFAMFSGPCQPGSLPSPRCPRGIKGGLLPFYSHCRRRQAIPLVRMRFRSYSESPTSLIASVQAGEGAGRRQAKGRWNRRRAVRPASRAVRTLGYAVVGLAALLPAGCGAHSYWDRLTSRDLTWQQRLWSSDEPMDVLVNSTDYA